MTFPIQDFYNWPNLVSFLRLLMTPVLFLLAINQQAGWFLAVVIFSGFTDVLDGYLARRLNLITDLGSHLDSWGDFFIYTSMAVCAWILWPDILRQELVSYLVILVSFTLPVLIGLIKFHRLTSYHTWSVKLAVAVSVLSYLLLFSGIVDWPFRVAAVLCAYAAIEEILITMIMSHEHVDIRSVWQALRYQQKDNPESP